MKARCNCGPTSSAHYVEHAQRCYRIHKGLNRDARHFKKYAQQWMRKAAKAYRKEQAKHAQ